MSLDRANPRSRQHEDVTAGGVRHWWACVPLTDAVQAVVEAEQERPLDGEGHLSGLGPAVEGQWALTTRLDALLDELVLAGWAGEFDARERSALEKLGWTRPEAEQERPLDALREALYAEVGKRLTDARIDAIMRDSAIPLHGRPVDITSRYVAALVRTEAKLAVTVALTEHAKPLIHDEPVEET